LAQLSKVAKQATVAFVGDKRVAELPEELAQRLVVFVERGTGSDTVALVVGEEEAAQVYSNLGESLRNVSEHGNAGELGLGDKAAPLLDFRQLNPGKDAKGQ